MKMSYTRHMMKLHNLRLDSFTVEEIGMIAGPTLGGCSINIAALSLVHLQRLDLLTNEHGNPVYKVRNFL